MEKVVNAQKKLTWQKLFLLTFFVSTQVWSLVPMESLVLGDLSKYYSQEKQDPLESIFQSIGQMRNDVQDESLEKSMEKLAYYRGMAQEGHNLKNTCSRSDRIDPVYATSFDQEQAVRSVLANLQYLGLDYTIRALAQYAKYFNFTSNEYQNLVLNLVGNYCSQNISVISIAQLKKNMIARFEGDNSFVLPTLENNPLMPAKLSSSIPLDDARAREMKVTLNLFKSFCSWGGLTDNLRLLPALLKHPVIMSFLIQEMVGTKVVWDKVSNTLKKENTKDSAAVVCENLICRRVSRVKFNEKMPRMVGSLSLGDDLRRLYCHKFQGVDFQTENQEPKIKEMILQMKSSDGPLLGAQLVALISTVPDLMVRSENFQDAQVYTRYSIDETWDNWASKQSDNFSRDLYYEESLSLELVKRELYFKPNDKKLKVLIDINLGEYDRINQMVGKVSSTFHLRISKRFLKWARLQWYSNLKNRTEIQADVQKKLALLIEDQVLMAREKFVAAPWSGALHELIAGEILDQLSFFPEDTYTSLDAGFEEIPIQLNFGVFALRHFRYRHQIEKNKIQGQRRLKSVELSNEEKLSLDKR